MTTTISVLSDRGCIDTYKNPVTKNDRRELVFTVESTEFVTYGKDHLYHCSKCNKSFTFKEAVLQKPLCADGEGIR